MKIQNNISQNYNFYKSTTTKPTFKSTMVETIKHTNIGMCHNGIIGKVRVRNSKGQETFLNVMKNAVVGGEETYQLQENFGKIIGEITLKFRKSMHDTGYYQNDACNVFVEYLRNYSKKGTPYTRPGLEEYKDIGTRLIQIAQRRSDEMGCFGNIELMSKNASMDFYKKLGFESIPKIFGYECNNRMYLPPHSKEPLSRLSGGL